MPVYPADADDADIRRYLLNYLARPQWQARSWDEISDRALLPEPPEALARLFGEEARIVGDIHARLDAIAAADAELDRRILDLYGITDRLTASAFWAARLRLRTLRKPRKREFLPSSGLRPPSPCKGEG